MRKIYCPYCKKLVNLEYAEYLETDNGLEKSPICPECENYITE